KAIDVVAVVCFFEHPDPDAAKMRATLHQGLVAKQDGLAVQARLPHQNGVDGAGPLDRFLEQRNRDVDAFVLEGFGNPEGALVEPFEIPFDEGNIVLAGIVGGPRRRHDDVAPIEAFHGIDGVEAPAEQGDIALVGMLVPAALANDLQTGRRRRLLLVDPGYLLAACGYASGFTCKPNTGRENAA